MFDWIKLDFIAKWFSKEKSVDVSAFIGMDGNQNFMDSWGKQRKPDKKALVKEYRGIAYACANINAQGCIKPALRLYRKSNVGQKSTKYPSKILNYGEIKKLQKATSIRISDKQRIEEIIEHPSLDRLDHPNTCLDRIALFEFNQLYQEIVGKCYWWCPFNGLGTPVNINLMLPQYTKPIIDEETGLIFEYEYGVGADKKRFPAKGKEGIVIPFLLPNLQDPFNDGMSPINSVYESINIQNKYNATEAAMLDNSGRADGILKAKEEIGEDEAARLERRFNNKLRRAGNGGLLVLGQDMDYQTITYSPRDLARLEIEETSKIKICNSYGVPIAVFEQAGTSQYGVLETIDAAHAKRAIIPRLRRTESVLNHYYLPLFDDTGRLFFAYDDPTPENEEIEIKKNDTYVKSGILTQNEVRLKLGYDPHPDGDRLANPIGTAAQEPTDTEASTDKPEAEIPIENTEQDIQTLPDNTLNGIQISSAMDIVIQVATGVLPLDTGLGSLEVLLNLSREQAETVMGSAGSFKPKPQEEKNETSEEQAEEDTGKEKPEKKTCDCGIIHKAHIQGHNRPLPDGKELKSVLKNFFSKQKSEILSNLNKHKAIKNIPDRFIHLDKWDKELFTDAQPVIQLYYQQSYEAQAKEIVARTGIEPDRFNVANPHIKTEIKKLTLHFCKETNETTSRDLNKALDELREEFEQGLAENIGDRPAELVNRVKDIFDGAEDFRAERIAQTEASRSHHEAARQSAKDSGVVKGFTLMLSTAACELCQSVAREGMIGLDDDFYTDENASEAYKDKFVPIHPNCECTVEMVLNNEGDE